MFITISAVKKKLTVLLLVIALIIMGLWGAPRVFQPGTKEDPAIATTIGEKGAPPLLERVVNRLRVYYRYR